MASIYAYKQGSASALALAAALGIKCIKHEGSRFKGRHNKTVINWGAVHCRLKLVSVTS